MHSKAKITPFWASAVAITRSAAMDGTPVMKRQLQSIKNEACMRGPGRPLADNATGEDVDDEGHADKTAPGPSVSRRPPSKGLSEHRWRPLRS